MITMQKCDSCGGDMIEKYVKCECRLCEDWGGCKMIDGYDVLKCVKCDVQIAIKTYNKSYNHKGK